MISVTVSTNGLSLSYDIVSCSSSTSPLLSPIVITDGDGILCLVSSCFVGVVRVVSVEIIVLAAVRISLDFAVFVLVFVVDVVLMVVLTVLLLLLLLFEKRRALFASFMFMISVRWLRRSCFFILAAFVLRF